MSTLLLGNCDSGKKPNEPKQFLKPYHMDGLLLNVQSFRDDDNTKWRRFSEAPGNQVAELQAFLKAAGFMPRATADGVFGYVTQAGTRLFQEYVRTIEGIRDMVPDGIVGNNTQKHIKRWQAAGYISEWGKGWDPAGPQNKSPEYDKWIGLLNRAKEHYEQNPNPILTQVALFNKPTDTRKISDWEFDAKEVHLIGIRRSQDSRQLKRENDDIFILLINGQVFKFWGSTDPSQALSDRKDEAFLVEGQHKYRFGWHKIFTESKIYRALKPYQYGVLVYRDRDDDNALTEADLKSGLDPASNNTINIHWSGIGSTNFSAGCQVIAGRSYINNRDQVIDCSAFAARSYGAVKKTKGAYNMLTDLILCYAPPDTNYIYYTLGREESLKLDAALGSKYAPETLDRMRRLPIS